MESFICSFEISFLNLENNDIDVEMAMPCLCDDKYQFQENIGIGSTYFGLPKLLTYLPCILSTYKAYN